MEVPVDMPEEDIKEKAVELENVKNHIRGKKILKAIVVPNKLVNFVVK